MDYKDRMEKIVSYAIENDTFNKARMVENAKNVCVFGLGTFFKEAFASKKVKENYHVNWLSDNDPAKWGKKVQGLPIVSPEKLKDIEDLVVIIMVGNPSPIEKQMNKLGIRWITFVDLTVDDELGFTKDINKIIIERELIASGVDFYEDKESKEIYVECLANRMAYPMAQKEYEELFSPIEYFGVDILPLSDQEVYVDCGAFDGDTIERFIEETRHFNHIYGFELDKANYDKCVSRFSADSRITLIHKGVWDENKEIEYSGGDGENEPADGISIMKAAKWESKNTALVTRMDDELTDVDVTYIKMDIEGAELNALKGAESVIKKCKPKLAICVYHKTSDFWKIPQYIKTLNSDYKIYLRHHSNKNCWGTVLYAK